VRSARARPFLGAQAIRDDAKFELELEQAATQLGLLQYLQEGSTRRAECFEA
jgi:hypothetical protein